MLISRQHSNFIYSSKIEKPQRYWQFHVFDKHWNNDHRSEVQYQGPDLYFQK